MRLGLELPPLGAPGSLRRPRVAEWREAAAAAEGAGFDSVWLAPGGCDPCTLAGALAAVTGSITLGVVSSVGPEDRNPSVLARDLTGLDVLSGGRAAVLLEADPATAAEAVAVCRLLFAGVEADFDGARFHLAKAVNLPPPLRAPAVLVQSPAPPLGVAADGWVVTVGPGEVAAWRREAGPTPLFWRGALGADPAASADALLGAGVDGLIVQVPASAAEVASVGRRLT